MRLPVSWRSSERPGAPAEPGRFRAVRPGWSGRAWRTETLHLPPESVTTRDVPTKRARTNVHSGRPDQFLADVARAYYEQHMTQEEIAGLHGVSRSQVSRYLQEAYDREIVQIRITLPESRDTALERSLTDRFPHLREAVVAGSFSELEAARRRAVARATARLLARRVTSSMTVCFGAGRTLADAVALLEPGPRRNVVVVQAMGNAGHEGLEIDYNAIAQAAATAFGGRAYQINAPAIVGPSARASDLEASSTQIAESLRIARSADMYVLGIGSMSTDVIYVKTGLIAASELEALRDAGAVGDMCGNFYDARGRACPGPFADRLVGIRLADLRRASTVIACASGAEKVPAIAGALEGRLATALVTDEHTARGVLGVTPGSRRVPSPTPAT
jgi:deoxyribonucleoside regulator